MLYSHSKGQEIKPETDNLAQNERLSLISQYVPISLETTAENEPESTVSVADGDEEPFPEPFLHDDQFDNASWPGQERIIMGERPVLEAEKASISVTARMIAKNGLVKALYRLKHIKENTTGAYYMANVRLAVARDKVMNALTAPEYKKNRRAVLAIGTVAVTAAGAYFAYKGFIAPNGNSANHAHETASNVVHHHAAAKNAAPATHPPVKKVQVAATHIHKAVEHLRYQTAHLSYAGDTIWYHAQSKMQAALGHKPSAEELNDYVRRTLKFNKLSWESARHMAKGQAFKLPSILR